MCLIFERSQERFISMVNPYFSPKQCKKKLTLKGNKGKITHVLCEKVPRYLEYFHIA